MDLFSTLFVIVAVFCVYLFPAIVASLRDRPNRDAITVFNLLLGWTVIGWVLSLIWAMTSTNSQLTEKVATAPGRTPVGNEVAMADLPLSWRAPVALIDGEAAQSVLRNLVEGDRVRLIDFKDRVVVRFDETDLGTLDQLDERQARAHVAKSRRLFARVAAVTDTNPKRLIVTINAA